MKHGLSMDIGFQFEVIYKDEDMLQVTISAWNGTFGGAADVYVGIGELEETSKKINGFPSHPLDTRELMLGTFDRKFAGGGISMRFHCIDGAGHAFIESRIESGHESAGTLQSALFSIHVEAAAIDSFANGLRRLEKEGTGKAFLKGTNKS